MRTVSRAPRAAVPAQPGPRTGPEVRPTDPLALEHALAVGDALRRSGAGLDLAAAWGRRLAALMPGGYRLLIAGNGGSAAEAQHLSAEFVGRFRHDRAAFSAIALHADTSAFTAIVNDYGPLEAFARQVDAHGQPGDVLLLLSSSGRSGNLLRAAERAGVRGLQVWAMTGPLPNPLAELADETVVVESPLGSAVQEVQLVAGHLLCAAFDEALAAQETGAPPRAGMLR
jgi:D-sedoheptulose 7-phosphate isomerase